MAHTNSTTNYSLPQWVGTDKPTFLGDFNTAFSDIDGQMKTNADNIVIADTKAVNAQTSVNSLSSDVTALTTRVSTAEGNITSQGSLIQTNSDNITNLTTSVGTINTTLLNKQDTITGGASTVTTNNLSSDRALVSDSNGKITNSSVSATEIGYLSGVTSSVQTQLNAKSGKTWSLLLNKPIPSSDTTYTVQDMSNYNEFFIAFMHTDLMVDSHTIPYELASLAYRIWFDDNNNSCYVAHDSSTTITITGNTYFSQNSYGVVVYVR